MSSDSAISLVSIKHWNRESAEDDYVWQCSTGIRALFSEQKSGSKMRKQGEITRLPFTPPSIVMYEASHLNVLEFLKLSKIASTESFINSSLGKACTCTSNPLCATSSLSKT
eukprot:TRINITY_DN9671_c0_g1_i14.p2 TRINITY_DN9671_c0_g1~~TRINITY_DN9671_c0_g1_i14.p2  ORF type:complete len:112 (-),score=17.12 TRINITY_DN9671_c0_g1_i14:559-894(-)